LIAKENMKDRISEHLYSAAVDFSKRYCKFLQSHNISFPDLESYEDKNGNIELVFCFYSQNLELIFREENIFLHLFPLSGQMTFLVPYAERESAYNLTLNMLNLRRYLCFNSSSCNIEEVN